MFIYPEINPILLAIGPLKIRWYGLMYVIGFIAAWLLANYRANKPLYGEWSKEQISDVLFYAMIGVIVGGRLGEMVFYEYYNLIHDPLSVFKIWQGGMSFHGGALGVIIAWLLVRRKINKTFFEITDFFLPFLPIGLGAGRLGNFINGELWGRVTDVPWAMVFPHVDQNSRHPSQLYEFLFEGVFLFILLWFYSAKPRPRMAVTGLFALGYGVVRFIIEFFREPEPQQGFLFANWLTMGQLLSIPLILFGVGLLIYVYKRKALTCSNI